MRVVLLLLTTAAGLKNYAVKVCPRRKHRPDGLTAPQLQAALQRWNKARIAEASRSRSRGKR
jgi:hypothetical protein